MFSDTMWPNLTEFINSRIFDHFVWILELIHFICVFTAGVQSTVRTCNEVGKTTCFGNWQDNVDGVDKYERFKKKIQRCNTHGCPGTIKSCFINKLCEANLVYFIL